MGSFMAISHDPARPKRLPFTDMGKRRPDIIPRTTSNSNFLLNIISFFLPRYITHSNRRIASEQHF
jgi:hypothetical protein